MMMIMMVMRKRMLSPPCPHQSLPLAVSQFVASKASNYFVPLVLGHLHCDPGVAIAAMLGIAKQKCGKCAHCKIKIFKHSFFIM